MDVLAGNAANASPALPLTEAGEHHTGMEVEETVGDCAFGDGATRQELADAGRKLVAKVPHTGREHQIHKSQFHTDLDAMPCTCPAGQTTANLIAMGFSRSRTGSDTVQLHPQEARLRQARAFQSSPQFQPYRPMRQTAEHRLARLVRLGIRQARSFGRKKTLFRLWLAATVANLTLIATQTGQMGAKTGPIFFVFCLAGSPG